MKTVRFLVAAVVTMVCMEMNAAEKYLLVKAGDAQSLLTAIARANRTNEAPGAERLCILVPDGVYDLGDITLTTITGNNISLVGESMEHTIIRNQPDIANEGISRTATIRITGTGTYLQDLTLHNDLKYYEAGFAGRAVCLHDRGTRTICKNVRMLSFQDTYYSDNEDAQLYLETTEIHGTVDFICGAGDVWFEQCTLVTERRTADGKGRCVIAAPRTSNTPWGYIFNHCTIVNNMSTFHFARAWKATPHCIFLYTTLATPDRLALPRFDSLGMSTAEADFREYHSTDADGHVVTPQSNMVTFTHNEARHAVETVLTADEAARYQVSQVFPSWRPDLLVKQWEEAYAQLKAKNF